MILIIFFVIQDGLVVVKHLEMKLCNKVLVFVILVCLARVQGLLSCIYTHDTCVRMNVFDVFCNRSSVELQFNYSISSDEIACEIYQSGINYLAVSLMEIPDSAPKKFLKTKIIDNPGIQKFDYFNPKGHSKHLKFKLFLGVSKEFADPLVSCPLQSFCNYTDYTTTVKPLYSSSTTNFTNVTTVKDPAHKNNLYFLLIGIFVIFCLFISLVLVILARRRNMNSKKRNYNCADAQKHQQSPNKIQSNVLNHLFTVESKPVKLFLVFANNNEKHRQVVLNFANFLQADLGFDVMCELFQSLEISVDPVSWMDYCMKQCNKVLVIWPPSPPMQSSSTNSKRDLFSPVLKNIRNDLFCGVNLDKYYFCYFDYCSIELIPEEFNASKVYHFHLMNDFEKLYYLLIEIKKYEPGGERKNEKVMIDKLFLKEINEYGPLLQDSLLEMNSYSKTNPNWYLENSIAESKQDSLIISANLTDDCMLSNIIKVSPPPPLTTDQPDISMKMINGDSDSIRNQSPSLSLQTASSILFDSIESNYKNEPFYNKHIPIINSEKARTDDINQNTNKITLSFVYDNVENKSEKHVNSYNHEESQKQNCLNDLTFSNQKDIADKNTSVFENKPNENVNYSSLTLFASQKTPSYDDCKKNSFEKFSPLVELDNTAQTKQTSDFKLTLAPIDSESDPMSSLMAINMMNSV